MIWVDGRIAWPLVFAALFSTAIILAADYAWRTVQAPVWLIVVAAAAILLACNAAIFFVAARSR